MNAVIESLDLIDLELGNRMFTWSNDHEDPLFQKLVRCLMSIDWEEMFPLVSVCALVRELSDHTPLLVDTGSGGFVAASFKFELCWLLRPELEVLVREVWTIDASNLSSLDAWQFRLRLLRRRLKGWNRNVEGLYKKEKKEILAQIDLIDRFSETFGLTAPDWEFRGFLKYRLKEIDKENDVKWWQRAKEQELLFGDGNTKFFMAKASGRRR